MPDNFVIMVWGTIEYGSRPFIVFIRGSGTMGQPWCTVVHNSIKIIQTGAEVRDNYNTKMLNTLCLFVLYTKQIKKSEISTFQRHSLCV